jgi:hypothetical protein
MVFIVKNELSKKLTLTNFIFNDELFFSFEEVFKIVSYEFAFDEFLFKILYKNIINKFLLDNNMINIIFKENEKYNFLFDENNILYQTIINNKVIVFDYVFTLLDCYSFISNDFNIINLENSRQIFFELNKYNIRVLFPLYKEKKIYAYIILNDKTFNIIKRFTYLDICFLLSLSDYISFCFDNLIYNTLYIKLIYQKKISEYNLIENYYKYDQIKRSLNLQIKNIRQILIYENNKKICTAFGDTDNEVVLGQLDTIYKREDNVSSNKYLQKKYYFEESIDNSCLFISSGKFKVNKDHISLFTYLPFMRKHDGVLYSFYNHARIDLLFPYNDNILNNDKNFFSLFDLGFNVKIIMTYVKNFSFFKILNFLTNSVNYQFIYISLKNVNEHNFKKIFDYYLYLLLEGKNYYIFFTDIEKETLLFQKIIIDEYKRLIFSEKKIYIKLFFILINEDNLNYLHEDIMHISKTLFFMTISLFKIPKSFLHLFLINYIGIIIKKKITISEIDFYFDNIDNNKFFNLYDFIDIIEEKITYKIDKVFYNKEFYFQEAVKLQKEALKNNILMRELLNICDNNYTKIANLIGVHKSTISRYFKNEKL